MCIPQTAIPFVVPPHPAQYLCSGRGAKIDVPYICCLDGQVTEAFEPWDLAEDGVCKVHPSAGVKLPNNFKEGNFHTHFFNARQIQIPFLGCRSVNMTVKVLNAACATQRVGSRVATQTENICVHSWDPYPTMIPHTVSTIKRRAYDVPVTPHALALRANHERLQLIYVERRRTLHRDFLALICQEMCDKVRDVLSNDSDNSCLEESDSD